MYVHNLSTILLFCNSLNIVQGVFHKLQATWPMKYILTNLHSCMKSRKPSLILPLRIVLTCALAPPVPRLPPLFVLTRVLAPLQFLFYHRVLSWLMFLHCGCFTCNGSLHCVGWLLATSLAAALCPDKCSHNSGTSLAIALCPDLCSKKIFFGEERGQWNGCPPFWSTIVFNRQYKGASVPRCKKMWWCAAHCGKLRQIAVNWRLYEALQNSFHVGISVKPKMLFGISNEKWHCGNLRHFAAICGNLQHGSNFWRLKLSCPLFYEPVEIIVDQNGATAPFPPFENIFSCFFQGGPTKRVRNRGYWLY